MGLAIVQDGLTMCGEDRFCDPFDIVQEHAYARCQVCGKEWVIVKENGNARWTEKPSAP